ncbi:HEPN/Toprim-associated domain-containing protein [Microbacterium lacticum]|uniref:HEPN/Toprim-associated domain-containing protein n=1 Tax=Microbacterium lacticum TaxID=33885 RepID=UPI001F58BDB7|nr:HEPN/Toprim-associated domain-containing protein [Microbacterium lacticum]
MGTEITLSLNGIDIDWGKNDYWTSHYWLFPPDSVARVDYFYADDVVETKPGFRTILEEAKFRMCHLGYSHDETKAKFSCAVDRWNRTADLALSYQDFRDALTSVNFTTLTPGDLEPFVWDFRRFVVNLLTDWDTDGAGLEDFILKLDFSLTLRALADRADSHSLPLVWRYQDLVDSGWVSMDDLIDIDRQTYIANHSVFVGRLQDHSGCYGLDDFDDWLVRQGVRRDTPYRRAQRDGTVREETLTLPMAVRHMIHHPENANNLLSDAALRRSTEILLDVARKPGNALPGLR